jgi:predicted MFS family arabinose efflux permease
MLADHHGLGRDRALVEANVGASAAAVLAPVVLGWLATGPLGWRVVMVVPALALVVLGLVFRRADLPRTNATGTTGSVSGRMSTRTWLLCALVGIVVGVEFCVVFYGAQLLHSTTGLDTVTAAAAMALFFAAELVGRVVGSGLTRRPGRGRPLLTSTLVVSLLGMLPLWLSPNPVVALIGLVLAGLGIANLFPLSLTLALTEAEGLTDKAAARSQFFVGTAIALGPLVLGALSDLWGVQRGFTAAVVLAVAALSLLLAVAGDSASLHRGRRSGVEHAK